MHSKGRRQPPFFFDGAELARSIKTQPQRRVCTYPVGLGKVARLFAPTRASRPARKHPGGPSQPPFFFAGLVARISRCSPFRFGISFSGVGGPLKAPCNMRCRRCSVSWSSLFTGGSMAIAETDAVEAIFKELRSAGPCFSSGSCRSVSPASDNSRELKERLDAILAKVFPDPPTGA